MSFLIALNIALGIIVVAWLHSPPLGYQSHQRESRPQATVTQHGVAGGTVANAGADEKSAKGHDQKDWVGYFLDHLPDWFVAAFTGLLTVVTYLLVRSTNRLWKAGEKQIAAAEMAALAAQKSADVAEASLVKLQRASVFTPDINNSWHPDTGRPGKFWYRFRPIWQNSGSTQTKDMIGNVVYVLRDTPLPLDFDFPANPESFPAIIPPRGFIFGASGVLTDDQLAEVQSGTKFYYIYGTAMYRDVFDATPVHTTKFCRQVMGVLGNVSRPNAEPVEMFFAIVFPDHNTAE